MPTYVLLTKLSPEAIRSHEDFERLEKEVSNKIREECKEVHWLESYALLEPYDYLDLFEAPDPIAAIRVKMIIRSFGHTTSDPWPATPWSLFRTRVREAGGEGPIVKNITPIESTRSAPPKGTPLFERRLS